MPTSGPAWPAPARSGLEDAPVLGVTCAAPGPPVSALQIQLKNLKPNNQIKIFNVNAPFSMLTARNRSSMITFDIVIRKSQP